MDITSEITEAIKKNLPAQVGELLQKELAELPILRKQLASEKEMVKQRIELHNAADARNRELQAKLDAHTAIDKREQAVRNSEDALRIRDAVLAERLKQADEMKAIPMQVLGIVFQNRTVRETVTTNAIISGGERVETHYNGNGVSVPLVVKNSDMQMPETKTVETQHS